MPYWGNQEIGKAVDRGSVTASRGGEWAGAALGRDAEAKPGQSACTVGNRRRAGAPDGRPADCLDLGRTAWGPCDPERSEGGTRGLHVATDCPGRGR